MNRTSLIAAGAPAYSQTPLPRTHQPPKRTGSDGYAAYRPCLRLDFKHRCCYCLAHESEVGPSDKYGGFEIEHFRPQGRNEFRRFINFYPNLLWACHACNRAKGETWPTKDELARGERFVDPSDEPLGAFLILNGEEISPASPANAAAARFMIDEIGLDSETHIQRRKRRKLVMNAIATLEGRLLTYQARLAASSPDPALQAEIAATEQELALAASDFGASLPWDVPEWCHCDSD